MLVGVVLLISGGPLLLGTSTYLVLRRRGPCAAGATLPVVLAYGAWSLVVWLWPSSPAVSPPAYVPADPAPIAVQRAHLVAAAPAPARRAALARLSDAQLAAHLEAARRAKEVRLQQATDVAFAAARTQNQFWQWIILLPTTIGAAAVGYYLDRKPHPLKPR